MAFSRPPNVSSAADKPNTSVVCTDVQETQHPPVPTVPAQKGVLLCVKRKRDESANEVVVLEERPTKLRRQDVDNLMFSMGALSLSKQKNTATKKSTDRKVFRYLGQKEEVFVSRDKEAKVDLQKKIAQVKEKRKNTQTVETELNLDQRTKMTQVRTIFWALLRFRLHLGLLDYRK